MGRKPKPLSTKLIEGIHSHVQLERAYKDSEAIREAIDNPPETLSDEEKKAFTRFGKDAIAVGVLTLADVEGLILLARTHVEIEKEYEALKGEERYYYTSNGIMKTNERIATLHKLIERKIRLMNLYYLSPSIRNEIAALSGGATADAKETAIRSLKERAKVQAGE